MEIKKCRICKSSDLWSIIDLGRLAFTGIFPKKGERVKKGRLELIKCRKCGLVQLRDNFDLKEMYGDSYGYRSGLNDSMVQHLSRIAEKVMNSTNLNFGFNIKDELVLPKDIIIDIGSSDGTLLGLLPETLRLIGIDPTIKKFGKYYEPHIGKIPEFFSKGQVEEKAKVITSLAMLYDLHDPLQFFQDVCDSLVDDGIWITEQCYLPSMIDNLTYDTICHEHVEYYGLKQIKYMADKVGLKIVDVELNDINGGSFCVTMSKLGKESPMVESFLKKEERFDYEEPFANFAWRIRKHKRMVQSFFRKNEDKLVLGYGASTKGNVILQHCEITKKQMPFIGEVNEDKFGRLTPGTRIPIINEVEAREMNPDFFFVLPWHFRVGITKKERAFRKKGKLVFPLPNLEVV